MPGGEHVSLGMQELLHPQRDVVRSFKTKADLTLSCLLLG